MKIEIDHALRDAFPPAEVAVGVASLARRKGYRVIKTGSLAIIERLGLAAVRARQYPDQVDSWIGPIAAVEDWLLARPEIVEGEAVGA